MSWNINREISRHICLAQIASDAGKGKYRLHIKGDENAVALGYPEKDKEILKAISLINSVDISTTDFRYCVTEESDQNGTTSRIVYFYDTKNKLQISFHTFCGKIKKHKGEGTHMFWCGKQSAQFVKKLIEIYYL